MRWGCRVNAPVLLAQTGAASLAEKKQPPVHVTLYRLETQPQPARQGNSAPGSLASFLQKRDIREKKSGAAFALHKLKDGGTRRNTDVVSLSGVIADIDNGGTYEELQTRIADYWHVAYSTHSHDPENGAYKFRLVFLFTREIKPEEFFPVWVGLNGLLGGVMDAACKDPARLFFLPSCPAETADKAFYRFNEGRFVDPDELKNPVPTHAVAQLDELRSHPQIPPPEETPENIERVKAMLQHIPANCPYEQWRNAGWALKATGWNRADSLFSDWSKTAPEKFDVRATHNVLDTYDPAGGIGFGTLVFYAKQNGYADKPLQQGNTPATDFATAEPGDITAGRLFATVHQGKLLHVGQAGRWLVWDGTRWTWCACGEEIAAAKKIAAGTLQWASRLYSEDAEKHKRRMAFALRLQNLPRLEAMVELAVSEPGMTVGHMYELDLDPWLLGVRNGVVNLKDGTLLAPDPAMKITRQAAAEYHPETTCPLWLHFLTQVFDGDADTVGFIQRALGYTLTGTTTEEVLFICYGGGANGKSVFANVLSAILADYGQMAPPALLTVRRDGDAGPRNDVARLCGARLVQVNELNQGDRLDEQVVKMLAGREMLSARFLHKEYFDFWPTAKPWLRTNHRPVITGEDDGIWRRIMLIPFKRKFAEDERDPWLESKLLKERDGILAWMVQGCLDWQRDKLKPSPLVRKESAIYRKESDLLGEFLDEKTEADPNERIEQLTAFSAWKTWADANGVRHGSKVSFTRKLSERGFSEARSNGMRYYAGLKLKIGV